MTSQTAERSTALGQLIAATREAVPADREDGRVVL
ncbi:hypothetical protein LAUMK41_04316 [Mycobacterium attenuatum]|nr:hypothetical protein LAUMK41_04316 [Mycobacterium attenuatum]